MGMILGSGGGRGGGGSGQSVMLMGMSVMIVMRMMMMMKRMMMMTAVGGEAVGSVEPGVMGRKVRMQVRGGGGGGEVGRKMRTAAVD